MNTYFLYIIQCIGDGGYYIGVTSNLERRVREHRKGQSAAIRFRRDWRVVYTERCATLAEARRKEITLKKKKSRKSIERYIHGMRP